MPGLDPGIQLPSSQSRGWAGLRPAMTAFPKLLPSPQRPYSYAAVRPRHAPSRHLSLADRQAPVAQLDRAPDYESGGQEFESLRARQFIDFLNGLKFLALIW